MKKLASIMVIALLAFLGACSTSDTTNDNSALDTENIGNQLATTIYISQGLLESDMMMSNARFAFLSTETTQLESRMDEMMMYFNRINVFINSNPETALSISQEESTMEGYESQVSYEVDGTTYTIYYNIVDAMEDEDLDETEFILEGLLEYGTNSFEITGGTELEDGELEMFFETSESASDDYVRVEIEQESTEQYFEIESSLGGVESYSEIRLEKDGVDGAIEIYIEENGLDTYYEITKEIDGEFTIYVFEYSIGDTSGSLQLTEYTVDGQDIQHFIIEEDDVYKEYTVPANAVTPDDM